VKKPENLKKRPNHRTTNTITHHRTAPPPPHLPMPTTSALQPFSPSALS
jgi:hypothetical protein